MQKIVPNVAAIHDISGFGRVSLTVIIPILSTLGVATCPLPTAVLSTHTNGFTGYSFLDLTAEMGKFIEHWQKLGLRFDAVYSGFLGHPEQTKLVEECIKKCLGQDGIVVVDPVLGEDGQLLPTMNEEMVRAMRTLTGQADIITPNLTEAALLLEEPPKRLGEGLGRKESIAWLRRLADLGPRIVVITSVPVEDCPNKTSVIAYHREHNSFWRVDCHYVPAHYPGTGDAFTSVLTGSILRGDSLPIALDRAVQFVTLGVRATFGHNLPLRDGILLERVLDTLNSPLGMSSYEIINAD